MKHNGDLMVGDKIMLKKSEMGDNQKMEHEMKDAEKMPMDKSAMEKMMKEMMEKMMKEMMGKMKM